MTILVTGASGGIGRAICLEFFKKGHEVVGLDVRPAVIETEHYTHILYDIREEDLPGLPPVDVLVNCAGVQLQTAEDIQNVL